MAVRIHRRPVRERVQGGRERPRRTRDLVLRATILVGLGVLILSVVLTSPLLQPISPGAPVEIRFRDLDNRQYSTAAGPLHGQVLLLDLMAATCPPCNAEMPELLALRESLRDTGVIMISLSLWVDQPGFGETVADLEDFTTRWGADWIFGVPEDSLALVLEYNIQFPPFKILLDSEGRVARTIPGETTAAFILDALEAIT